MLPIFVRAQNAGVLLTKKSVTIHIESFELSPRNQSIIQTLGRLQRDFPGPAIALDLETFVQSGLRDTIATTLAKMSHQSVQGTKPKVRKAGQGHDEDRDTTDPKMVTELFMSFLRPMCDNVENSQIQKNTRDEVMWHNAKYPWRRSSFWLLVRVILQVAFRRLSSQTEMSDDLYKHFLVYFMSTVIDISRETMPREHIHVMNVKVARRLLKLNLSGDPSWFPSVQHALERASSTVQRCWQKVMSQHRLEHNMSSLETLEFDEDIRYTLSSLDKYLEEIHRQEDRHFQASVEFSPRSSLVHYQATELPSYVSFTNPEYKTYNLAAFEAWVASNLDEWIRSYLGDAATCGRLGALIQNYHQVAFPVYSSNPEAISNMLLTILELWIACDRSATHIYGMLADYDPCVPEGMLESLLLPFRSQMERLARAENYLHKRRQDLRYYGPGIFLDFGTPTCFSVRYFNQSDRHQRLQADIEAAASLQRSEKQNELRQKHRKYTELMDQAARMQCDSHEIIIDRRFKFREFRHDEYSCKKCGYQREANCITIHVHEWPLPANLSASKSTVFELNVPRSFGHWRDATLFFLCNVLQAEYASEVAPLAKYTPQGYRGLSPYFTYVDSGLRIGLLSEVKPHEGTHRRDKEIIRVTEKDVCLNNGLRWKYYDNAVGCFISGFEANYATAKACNYKLPRRCSSLQRFLFRPADNHDGLPHNSVIASQFSSPVDMSLEEYKPLCALPLGVRIQWQNILLQLAMPSVDFKKVETSIFMLQVINQAGPPIEESTSRQSHEVLNDHSFASAILNRIEETTERFEENWEFVHGLSVLIFLTLRVLSLSSSAEIHDECLKRLSHLREIAFKWVNQVSEKASCTVDDEPKNSLLARSVHIALICAETFDCEEKSLNRSLANSSDASIYIRCCMIVNDRKQVLPVDFDPILPILLRRWHCLAYRCYPILARNIIRHGTPALDVAIKMSWTAYCASSSWSAASDEDETWVVSRTASQLASDESLLVHFNLLTGELLVNGLPLARLPSEYERHETYKRLFGQSLLEVMPSEVPRMQFSCQKEHMGYTVHLGKEKIADSAGYDLHVQARKGDRIYEFVLPRLLDGLFPDAFVDDYVHWYDRDGGYVEFRPAKEPWVSSESNWRLQLNDSQEVWFLVQDGVYLVNVRSRTANLLSEMLKPVEKPTKVHCLFDPKKSVLDIVIPRFQLSYSLQSGFSSIRSRQYRGMCIDADQSLDTLAGLRNKLVLVHETSEDRLVLVPEGGVSWNKDGDHVAVHIGWQADTRIHPYSVDRQLGRLVDNGSLQGKLFLSYLHALTSFCLPDPLTKKTGTEQALSILRSAAVRSFDKLRLENCTVLAKIAQLTPERWYYPDNKRVMQTVRWHHDLGFLTQHGSFYLEVAKILEQDRQMGIFHPDNLAPHPPLPRVEADLLKREKIRSSAFRVTGFGAEDYTLEYDCRYISLDRNHNSKECSRVYTVSKMIYDNIPSVRSNTAKGLASCLWEFLEASNTIQGPSASLDARQLVYDAGFILDPTELTSKYLCSIHRLLCSTRPRLNRFQLMMWLATLAFSEKISMAVLGTLASLYILPETASIYSPVKEFFVLREGTMINEGKMRSLIYSATLDQTPESHLSPGTYETWSAFQSRIRAIEEENRNRAVDKFMAYLHKIWPVREPQRPQSWDLPRLPDYFDIQKVMEHVRAKFAIWHDNKEFREYLARLASLLSAQEIRLVKMPSISSPCHQKPFTRGRRFVCVDDILGYPPVFDTRPPQLCELLETQSLDQNPAPQTLNLAKTLEFQTKSQYEERYVEQLQSSIQSFQEANKKTRININASRLRKVFLDYQTQCETYCQYVYATIILCITPSGGVSEPGSQGDALDQKTLALLEAIAYWPRLSPTMLLTQLARGRWHQLPKQWQACLIAYGKSITAFQRAKRLASLTDHHDDLIRELQNPGHINWDPHEFPESLLLEIENGILIRDVQEEIAQQMRNLSPGHNAVMQLNMGEGKSSVIVPIVAAALANSSQLIRVLVAKPQSRQMFHMLVSKLGGLLCRRVYHMPVSRSLKFGEMEAREIERMCRECMSEGGVLLVQPEHILSLKLMCLECFIAGKEAVGRSLLRTLDLFRTTSRDIVDESDENFSVKFELVYTMGAQCPLELSPQRWAVIQQLLDLVRMYAPDVKEEFPWSIEIDEQRPGSFPRIRLLHSDAQQALSQRIAKHVCDIGIDCLPISRQPKEIRDAVFSYILEPELTADQIAAVEDKDPRRFFTKTMQGPLLLVRGLLAGGVLDFCFGQKRWRVNYGPHTTRSPPTKLSVPYRAKDSPAPRSEFSHPDVVIVLTSLSYYYAGLSDEDLFRALQHLAKSDQAGIEYQAWVKDAPELPPAYRHLGGINLEDRHHCVQFIFPNLRFSKGATDYFLSHIVFAKEMKEFPDKLSASGWDTGEVKAHPTVGFSGTNDSRNTLPLSVKQLDLPSQNHTNALVLEYLLRPENSVAFIPPRDEPSVSASQLLLNMVTSLDPATQVILDVGAQIIELSNLEVAKHWLRMVPNDGRIHAIVFVNDSDEICVLDRNGRIEPLQTSPFAKQLEACYVFLDEAHTRGIDLKLPLSYRAAVTLGPSITKDKLVQGKNLEW